jgi:drug/metabolite transporter, DME family
MQKTSNLSRGYLIGVAATVLLSFTGILISYLNKTYALPSLVLAFWRDISVTFGLIVVFLVGSRWRFQLDRGHRWFFILYGLTLALFNSMWTFSVQFNGAAVATVLAFSSPAMTAILARFFLKEQINSIKLASIVLTLVGTVLVSGAHNPAAWKLNTAGIAFGLLTGFFFACYNMLGKTSANKSIDSWTTLLYGFGTATIFLFIFNLLSNSVAHQGTFANFLWLGNAYSGWVVLVLLGIGPTIGGYGLYLMSLGYLSATVANLISALEPAFTTIWAYLLLSEQMTGIQWLGSLFIFGGVILLRLGEGGNNT